jgi:hypothetical protein
LDGTKPWEFPCAALTLFGHPGWNAGFHNMMIACPETGQGMIWMSNGEKG